jgi:hypothetical protein
MTSPYQYRSDPSGIWYKVTPSDTEDLPNGPCRMLYIGTAGSVALLGAGMDAPSTPPAAFVLAVGIHNLACRRVYSTGIVTADNIWALY